MDISARFVEEVVEDGSGDHFCGCGASATRSGFNEGHAVVGFEFLEDW